MFVRRRLGDLNNICGLSKTIESNNPSNGLKALGDTFFLTNHKVLRKVCNMISLKLLVLTSIAARLTSFKILSNLGDNSSWIGFKTYSWVALENLRNSLIELLCDSEDRILEVDNTHLRKWGTKLEGLGNSNDVYILLSTAELTCKLALAGNLINGLVIGNTCDLIILNISDIGLMLTVGLITFYISIGAKIMADLLTINDLCLAQYLTQKRFMRWWGSASRLTELSSVIFAVESTIIMGRLLVATRELAAISKKSKVFCLLGLSKSS